MGEYRFGLHSGEVSEYLFGVHYGHLTAPADQIAGRHGVSTTRTRTGSAAAGLRAPIVARNSIKR